MTIRVQIQVQGIVQGVGFRPFVYSLARKHSLNGCVLNNPVGVLIDIEGARETLKDFVSELRAEAPALAQIESLQNDARVCDVRRLSRRVRRPRQQKTSPGANSLRAVWAAGFTACRGGPVCPPRFWADTRVRPCRAGHYARRRYPANNCFARGRKDCRAQTMKGKPRLNSNR